MSQGPRSINVLLPYKCCFIQHIIYGGATHDIQHILVNKTGLSVALDDQGNTWGNTSGATHWQHIPG